MDKVILKQMPFDLPVGLDAWRRFHKPQPALITLEVQLSSTLEPAASKDDVNLSLDYGKLYKRIAESLRNVDPEAFPTIRALISHLLALVHAPDIPPANVIDMEILLPKALPQSLGGLLYQYQVSQPQLELETSSLALTIKQIGCNCIVGVNPHERLYKQTIYVDISVPMLDPSVGVSTLEEHYTAALHDMTQTVWERVEGSSYHTIEALATAIAQIVTVNYNHTVAKVRIDKPSAIATIDAAAVEITRSRTFFESKDFWKVKRP